MRAIEIFSNGKWNDVTSKTAVLYGIGGGLASWWRKAQVPTISLLVDGDSAKWGQEVQIGGAIHEIKNPIVLRDLDPGTYFILVPGQNYVSERLADVQRFCETPSVLIARGDDVRYVYETLSEMLLLDPIIHEKVMEQACSRNLQAYIDKFNSIINKSLGSISINRFIPIRRGHKISFSFGNSEKLWFCGIRGEICLNLSETVGWRPNDANLENLAKIYKVRKEYAIEKELTLYEDQDGFLLQHYANDIVDYHSEAVRYQVLQKLRSLHDLPIRLDITMEIVRRYKYEMARIKHRSDEIPEWISGIDKRMQSVIEVLSRTDWKKTLCHGDFHHGNIVGLEGKIYFIDWDFMCESDPFYDICRFLYYSSIEEHDNDTHRYDKATSELYNKLPTYLDIYYKRPCTLTERKHAFGMLLFCECVELFLRVLRRQDGTDDVAKILEKHLSDWELIV